MDSSDAFKSNTGAKWDDGESIIEGAAQVPDITIGEKLNAYMKSS